MKKFGPIIYFKCKKPKEGKDFISASLKGYEDAPFGFEWGRDGLEELGDYEISTPKLRLFSLTINKTSVELWILGFWLFWDR